MAHEWRDLFSERFLNNHWLPQVEKYHGQHSAKYKGCRQLASAVVSYHSIAKTDYSKLETRRKRLKAISKQAHALLKRLGGNEKQILATDSKGRNLPADGQTLDYWSQPVMRTILSIERRALRKAAYLKVLKNYYSSRDRRNADAFKSLIGAGPVRTDELVGLHQGVRLEQLDPLHRAIELPDEATVQVGLMDGGGVVQKVPVLVTGNDGKLVKIDIENALVGAYEQALADWFNGNTQIPFFLYLEDTPICLADDKGTNKNMAKVAYHRLDRKGANPPNRAKVMVCLIGDFGKIWWATPGTRHDDYRVCDTSSYFSKGKSDPGYAAYAFSANYELFLAKHEANFWHHSSFLSGDPVRGAGMIKIEQGKVTGLSNHSGHYRPGGLHLRRFGAYLEKMGVLGPGCIIDCRAPHFKGPWQQFRAIALK